MTTSVYTVNDQDDMRALVDLGVDGIITNYPDPLEQVLPAALTPREEVAGCRTRGPADLGGKRPNVALPAQAYGTSPRAKACDARTSSLTTSLSASSRGA